MQEWIKQTLESGAFSYTVLLASFFLGLVSSIACACCTFPILGAIVGYSGSRKGKGWQAVLLAGLFFMFGVIIATVILGSVAGFVGQVAQSTLGRYWNYIFLRARFRIELWKWPMICRASSKISVQY